jgi:serine/threonine protein kinase
MQNLLSRYAKTSQAYMPMKEAAHVSKAILDALSHVHSKGIMHRDIKSSNILVDIEGNSEDCMPIVKLCDFDSAIPLSSSAAHTCYLAHRGVPPVEACVGTPRWMAPEVFQAIYSQQAYGLVSPFAFER